jgi:hypothetical protein
MDRSKFKVPEPEVKKQRVIKPDTLSGISMPKNPAEQHFSTQKNPDVKPEEKELPAQPMINDQTSFVQEIQSDDSEERTTASDQADTQGSIDMQDSEAVKTPVDTEDSSQNIKMNAFALFWISLKEMGRSVWVYLGRLYKNRKIITYFAIGLAVIILAGIIYLVVLKKDNTSSQDKTASNSQQQAPAVNGVVAGANFIVFGPKTGSTFSATRADYSGDPTTGAISVEAKSTLPSDNRRITISEQKVPSNFEADPYGLKNLLVSVGKTYKVSTQNGTSYIVEAYTTALTVRGETLIFIRTTEALTSQEWIAVFDSLQPVVKNELGL